ncbi:hypothetical protein B0J11DRAFT_502471 [Dendryphion nanum]|uniref:Uncharacterized protein n=1 Tax=Dendryphion nanum TaxID=256645 RepID=A0A9P9IXA9_9PLEO|nr:hypothetical protein B0J11DRAFT_502471 [Dendryphion nanum]
MESKTNQIKDAAAPTHCTVPTHITLNDSISPVNTVDTEHFVPKSHNSNPPVYSPHHSTRPSQDAESIHTTRSDSVSSVNTEHLEIRSLNMPCPAYLPQHNPLAAQDADLEAGRTWMERRRMRRQQRQTRRAETSAERRARVQIWGSLVIVTGIVVVFVIATFGFKRIGGRGS